MNLINYPFDTQECSIYTAVFGYFDYQVKLSWATPDIYLRPPDTANALPLEVNPSIVLANFEISNQSYGISQTSSTWTGDTKIDNFVLWLYKNFGYLKLAVASIELA